MAYLIDIINTDNEINIIDNNINMAAYVQICNNDQQVLDFKTFASIKNAEKWAAKILNQMLIMA